jgi:pseudouridylate synthase
VNPPVALESTVFSALGLPDPWGREAYRRACTAIAGAGAEPRATAVIDGQIRVGLDECTFERLVRGPVRKVAARDLPFALAGAGTVGATTVSAALAMAASHGIDVFATGGIGGVHRDVPETDDVSADLAAIARHPVVTVCAGAKGFLDLGRTLERLESLGVPVVGLGTSELPAFWCRSSGLPLPHRVESVHEIADAVRAARTIVGGGMLVCVPCPESEALDRTEVDDAIDGALARARRAGVVGGAVTPFVLQQLAAALGDRLLRANVSLVENNARVAGELACALAAAD